MPGRAAGALNVLIIEDDDTVRAVCAQIAGSLGCHVRLAETVPDARVLLRETSADVIFLDLRLPGGTGASLMEEIRSTHPRAFVVIMTAYATVDSVVELMRNGAGDFLPKPFALDQVTAVLQKAGERRHWSDTSRALQDRLEGGIGAGRLIGQSPAMLKLFRIVSKVAFTRHPVLLLGEHGTGKEVVARAIHANGPSALQPFIPVDCDALASFRLADELFGEVLATGREKPGLLASAGEGTVYLAEVDHLDASLQAKLLRTLQERQIRRGGSASTVPLTARILASSSRDLEALVAEGQFRKDLFYRLNVVNLRVPPLRERPDDLILLVEYFLERQRRERGFPFQLSEQAIGALLGYDWPGNVEELESIVEHACAFSNGPLIEFEDMASPIRAHLTATKAPESIEPRSTATDDSPFRTLEQIERQAIEDALSRLSGDKVLAAKCLGIGKTTLYRKLKEYGISHEA